MKLWLDDIRAPHHHGAGGFEWAHTYKEAIAALAGGRVTYASLDHDLSETATIGQPTPGEKTGYDVVRWMEEHDVWPIDGVSVHSLNPGGRERMEAVIKKHYGRTWRWSVL